MFCINALACYFLEVFGRGCVKCLPVALNPSGPWVSAGVLTNEQGSGPVQSNTPLEEHWRDLPHVMAVFMQ